MASLVPRCRHYCQNFCSKDNYKFIVFRAFTLHLPIFEGIQTLFFFVNFQIWGRRFCEFQFITIQRICQQKCAAGYGTFPTLRQQKVGGVRKIAIFADFQYY